MEEDIKKYAPAHKKYVQVHIFYARMPSRSCINADETIGTKIAYNKSTGM